MIKQITNKTKILKFIGLFLDISYDQELTNSAKLEQQIKSIVQQKYSEINFESNWIRKNLLLTLIRLSLFGALRAGGFQKSHHPSYIRSGVSVLETSNLEESLVNFADVSIYSTKIRKFAKFEQY